MAVTLSQSAVDEMFAKTGRRLWLVKIDDPANGTHYLTNFSDTITFNGSDYTPTDLKIPDYALRFGADDSQLDVKVGNKDKNAQSWITDNDGLRGEDVVLKTLSPEATASSDEITTRPFIVEGSAWNEKWLKLKLTPWWNIQISATEPLERTGCGKFIPTEVEIMNRNIPRAFSSSDIS